MSDLVFKVATLYDNGKTDANKLKVRVLPDMISWDEKDLPWYPTFDISKDFHGCAEIDNKDYKKCSQFWVLCTPDYKFGWIFSDANFSSDISAEKSTNNWGFNTFRSHMSRCGLDTNRIDYREMKVLYTNKKAFELFTSSDIKEKNRVKTSTVVICTNVRTGDIWIMQGSGNVVYIGQTEFLLRYGSPDKIHSLVKINSETISLKAKNIVIDAEHTSLGKHGGNALATFGNLPFAVDGVSVIPCPDVTI